MNKAGFATVNPSTGDEIETTASYPRVPVGGVKNSGYGRELSHFGAHAFVNAQTVWIEAA